MVVVDLYKKIPHTFAPELQILRFVTAYCEFLTIGDCPLKPSGYIYVPPGLTLSNSVFCSHSVFMCSVWISEQTAIISLYSIN